jgi:aldehyde:ferredoxin oxidoreductase
MIAYREGFGEVLAEGAQRAAEVIGGNAARYVPTVKGLELMRPDPRATWKGNVFTSMSILTNPRGGDDLKGTHGVSNYPGVSSWGKKLGIDEDEYSRWLLDWLDMPSGFKERVFGNPPDINNPDELLMTYWYNHLTSPYNSLGLCMFSSSVADALGPNYQAKLYSTATGAEASAADIMEIGERVFNLMRMYIVREGFRRADDHWPDSFYEEPSIAGAETGPHFNREIFDEMLTRYYLLRGWDPETGIPTEDTLRHLGLGEIANDLPSM